MWLRCTSPHLTLPRGKLRQPLQGLSKVMLAISVQRSSLKQQPKPRPSTGLFYPKEAQVSSAIDFLCKSALDPGPVALCWGCDVAPPAAVVSGDQYWKLRLVWMSSRICCSSSSSNRPSRLQEGKQKKWVSQRQCSPPSSFVRANLRAPLAHLSAYP